MVPTNGTFGKAVARSTDGRPTYLGLPKVDQIFQTYGAGFAVQGRLSPPGGADINRGLLDLRDQATNKSMYNQPRALTGRRTYPKGPATPCKASYAVAIAPDRGRGLPDQQVFTTMITLNSRLGLVTAAKTTA
jgi:hypothetical protein